MTGSDPVSRDYRLISGDRRCPLDDRREQDGPGVPRPAGRVCRRSRIALSRERLESLDHPGGLTETGGFFPADRAWNGGGGRVSYRKKVAPGMS
jgi:hypothetical protein